MQANVTSNGTNLYCFVAMSCESIVTSESNVTFTCAILSCDALFVRTNSTIRMKEELLTFYRFQRITFDKQNLNKIRILFGKYCNRNLRRHLYVPI